MRDCARHRAKSRLKRVLAWAIHWRCGDIFSVNNLMQQCITSGVFLGSDCVWVQTANKPDARCKSKTIRNFGGLVLARLFNRYRGEASALYQTSLARFDHSIIALTSVQKFRYLLVPQVPGDGSSWRFLSVNRPGPASARGRRTLWCRARSIWRLAVGLSNLPNGTLPIALCR